jgi:hypothetical protein
MTLAETEKKYNFNFFLRPWGKILFVLFPGKEKISFFFFWKPREKKYYPVFSPWEYLTLPGIFHFITSFIPFYQDFALSSGKTRPSCAML